MSEVDQLSTYCDGLKRATQAYVKLRNATPLSEAIDKAAKYEMSHLSGEHKATREKPRREQQSRGRTSSRQSSDKKSVQQEVLQPGSLRPRGTDQTMLVEEGPDVAKASEEDLTKNEDTLNLLCDDPLVYNRALLFSIEGAMVQGGNKFGTKFLLDCGAMYRGRLGDNKMGESILAVVKIKIRLQFAPNYQCVAVVFAIPEKFDCVLGMPFFVDVHPDIDRKNRCFKEYVSNGASTTDISTPGGKCSPVNGSGLHVAVDCERASVIGRDSCRAAVPETQLEGKVESVERMYEDVGTLSRQEKKNASAATMFTIGVIDSEGVAAEYITRKKAEYITRKKLQKFLRLSAKNRPGHDFMIVLTNDII
ncbi:hypothetical protein PPTG_15252 [Phytophthora nicotianae INRA-310]|uniref:Uncharacterized protein n=1 Tax=Phytophthora nicotianae (strain INRA-310) TaxID=761204 RepID=W2PTI0_PHYN3|nr:hypothetical protein PPTG_15252 [Phytophthora nicotianae INRA-310]ETN03936.1 hypothetical protein PPTG_15252 [Phytophthora nicotianae INRA-310]